MKIIITTIPVVILACLTAYKKAFFNDFSLLGSSVFIYAAVLVFLLFRRVTICLLKSEALYRPERIIEKNRPFFINKTKWEDIYNIAMRQKQDYDISCGYIDTIREYVYSREPDYENDEKLRSLICKAFEY